MTMLCDCTNAPQIRQPLAVHGNRIAISHGPTDQAATRRLLTSVPDFESYGKRNPGLT
jgi:hypothetical protein